MRTFSPRVLPVFPERPQSAPSGGSVGLLSALRSMSGSGPDANVVLRPVAVIL